jgi:hypothetical protein
MKVLLLLSVLFTCQVFGQVINGYAEVTGITGNVLTLGAIDETGDTFEDDEWIVIMQMQDSVIGGNTANNANFGDLASIENAGIYEIRQVQSHTATTITLLNNPNFTYNFTQNSSVQVITLTQLGSPNYTTTGNMSAKDWDGTTGGVLAIYTPGTLTLEHNLSADYAGFQGAGPNAGTSDICRPNWYRRTSNDLRANKGEGIFKRTVNNQAAGRAKILNGGGGGSSHNGGGAGGGNYTAGGDGGPGWDNCSPSAGGLGGISLQTESSVGRIFMGGGGGAGEGNNNLSTDGGDGGGIILIRADEITTNACTGVTISANGENISFAGNDGGGGGGAGGTIVFEVNTWNITGACPLTVDASGGDGGDVNSAGTHGGGGGGGQGTVYYSVAEPATNVSTSTNNGTGGCNNNAVPCTSQAGSGGGTDGSGVQQLLTGPLPISLIDFRGELKTDVVNLYWTTASESYNDYFTVEKSANGENWEFLEKIDGAGNSSQMLNYFTVDKDPYLGVNYYRLKQTDFNGTYNYSEAVRIDLDGSKPFVYPNPASNMINIYKSNIQDYQLSMFNTLGQEIQIGSTIIDGNYTVDVSGLSKGIYVLVLSNSTEYFSVKVSIKD